MNLASDLRKKAEDRAAVLSGLSSSFKREESKRIDTSQANQRKGEVVKKLPTVSKGSVQHRVVNRPQSNHNIQQKKVGLTFNKSTAKGERGHVNHPAKRVGSAPSALPKSTSSASNTQAKRGRSSNGSTDLSADIVFDFVNRHHIQQAPGFVNPERVRDYLREQLQSKAIILENNRPLIPPSTSSSSAGRSRVSKRKLEDFLGISFDPVLPNDEQLQLMEEQWNTYYRRLNRNCDSSTQQLSRLSQIALVGACVSAHMCNEDEGSIQGTIISVTPKNYLICRQTSTNGSEAKGLVKVARRKCELLCVHLPKKKGEISIENTEEFQLVIHCDEQLVYQEKQLKQQNRGRKRRRKKN